MFKRAAFFSSRYKWLAMSNSMKQKSASVGLTKRRAIIPLIARATIFTFFIDAVPAATRRKIVRISFLLLNESEGLRSDNKRFSSVLSSIRKADLSSKNIPFSSFVDVKLAILSRNSINSSSESSEDNKSLTK